MRDLSEAIHSPWFCGGGGRRPVAAAWEKPEGKEQAGT